VTLKEKSISSDDTSAEQNTTKVANMDEE